MLDKECMMFALILRKYDHIIQVSVILREGKKIAASIKTIEKCLRKWMNQPVKTGIGQIDCQFGIFTLAKFRICHKNKHNYEAIYMVHFFLGHTQILCLKHLFTSHLTFHIKRKTEIAMPSICLLDETIVLTFTAPSDF